MPIETIARLFVTGPFQDLQRFMVGVETDKSRLPDEPFEGSVLWTFDPLPADMTEEDGPASYWGSAWGDFGTELVSLPDGYAQVAEYETAFESVPPMAGFSRVAAMFPSLIFTIVYDAREAHFSGTAVWAAGVLQCDTFSMNDTAHTVCIAGAGSG